ncbi:MAG: hypothetical protein P0Y52_08020 [Candidatus Brevundimonas phytovorans]|nr:hypothetical protein [Brevundimonas sp.]WEK56505.1 MAG: hypothetical protein P0Y52_08020 [Brevundimonas sp.]
MIVTTVGALLEQCVRVTWSCQWCRDGGKVDLQRIARHKGLSFSMLNHLPLCTNGDCKGMIRFQAHHGMRSHWLMTAEGDQKFQAHSDWLFQANIIERRRLAQKQRRAGLPKGEPKPTRPTESPDRRSP